MIAARIWGRTLACGLVVIAGCAESPQRVRMATTTSVENSGLLRELLHPFSDRFSVRVDVLPVGSGQALSLLGRGDVDVALTHDPDAEASAVAAGTIARYRKVMFNDFVVVGPAADPAGASRATTAADALRRIASSEMPFVSRGDASGTHARERLLWAAAGTAPAAGRHLEARQGMAATLRIASEREAYALTDRATFVQLQPRLRLRVVFEGGRRAPESEARHDAAGGEPFDEGATACAEAGDVSLHVGDHDARMRTRAPARMKKRRSGRCARSAGMRLETQRQCARERWATRRLGEPTAALCPAVGTDQMRGW